MSLPPSGFSGTVTGTATTAVTWSVGEGMTGEESGTTGSDGCYTAPVSTGSYHVSA
jgi:chitinase